jgi:nitrite reductase/ring-hydroxylating ferredoxin subunit
LEGRAARAEQAAHEVLIVGGEDHKTGQADDTNERFERLEAWTRERFPTSGVMEFRWSGQIMEPVDSLAFIGRNPGDQNIYVVTGDSGNGMTHGTIAGILLTDLILGRENEWATLYDPSRISLRAMPEFAKENLNAMAQFSDYVTSGDVDDVRKIAEGAGAVIRRGLRKVAVYRDTHGVVHELSAVCPHLGCIVDWNSTERSWDCPCHGSRFDSSGKVVNGPAIVGLGPAELSGACPITYLLRFVGPFTATFDSILNKGTLLIPFAEATPGTSEREKGVLPRSNTLGTDLAISSKPKPASPPLGGQDPINRIEMIRMTNVTGLGLSYSEPGTYWLRKRLPSLSVSREEHLFARR